MTVVFVNMVEQPMSPETFSFRLNTFRCIAINDGWASNIPASAFLPEAPPAILGEVLQDFGLSTDVFKLPAICMFVDTGQHRILFDTGGGRGHPSYGVFMPGPLQPDVNLGNLLTGLLDEGIDPASIDTVIFSHAHPEHVSGNTDIDGRLLYPNARFVWAKAEWQSIATQTIPNEDAEWDGWAGAARFARSQSLAIQDRTILVEPEVEIVPGVRLIPTPGDTPHHLCVEFSSGDQRLICLADTMHTPVEIRYPEWGVGGELAVQSRRQILERAGPNALLHGFHFPFPGLGRVYADSQGWNWRPGA